MRRFLGMLNYYRRFVPRAAQFQAPLIDALVSTNSKGAKPFPWTPELVQKFEICKRSLSHATLLQHPVSNASLGLFTDASSVHIGSCLQQMVNGKWFPLSFFSKKLTPQQTQWPAYYRELLAIYESVQHFRYILEVQHATIFTDHKPLLYAFLQRREKLPPPQLNQLSFISQFTTDIQFIKGEDNVVADAMSRVGIDAISLDENYEALAKSQATDLELSNLLKSSTSLNLTKVSAPGTDTPIYCDISTGKPRPYLTTPFRMAVFNKLHNLSHPGARATTRLMGDRYVWPSMRKDCRIWSQACNACQRSKVSRHNSAPPGKFDLPSGRFLHVHIDIIGPLPVCNEYRYCLTAIDRASRWPEVWPMRSITAEEVAETFTREWISRFGVPSVITTDQGSQFESDLFHRLLLQFATKRIRTTSYHPCANGMIERVHRQLKAALMCHNDSWVRSLPMVLLGMRSAYKEDLESTAAEMVYGEPLRLPGELLVPSVASGRIENPADFVVQLRQKMSSFRPLPATQHSQTSSFIFKNLVTSSHVFLRDDTVRRALQPPYTGPYKVLERSTDGKTYTLELKGKKVVVSVDRLKPAFVDHTEPYPAPSVPPTQVVQPPVPYAPSSQPAVGAKPMMPLQKQPYITRSGRRVRFKNLD